MILPRRDRPLRDGRRLRTARFAGAVSVAVGAALLASCAPVTPECNPFFPVPSGARWIYRDSRGGITLQRTVSVSTVEHDGRVTTASLAQSVSAAGQAASSAGTAVTTVRCAGGVVQITVQGAASGTAGDREASASVRAELPGLPSADKLVPGYRWKSEGRIDTKEGTSVSVTSIARDSEVAEVAPVKVGAGEFAAALQVSSTETLRTGSGTDAREARQEVREWYVRGLGLVKRDTRLSSAERTTGSVEELVGFTGLSPAP